ncbi:MAG: helix-turn-helix transcriptional regulator [Synergistaceae bacterium]|nr:helix-turn-helix transcriptional regulator [Synergistaceae bacterium]MBQ6736973.1 helix-turn-helix transcriptional regulator [Synergistaceae bacterium]MBQ7068163.1 helix-turn-helix transcriptional regulator [Synergistaceae bacterium]MBR0075095.1 helix-turn-helix transcriptional regulator [Synergistaceae bacterium]MBR0078773.1 helix-turn-helix transcriptional regulator [Synergistaceae bacterium]
MALKDEIKRRRNELNLSQVELVRLVGVPRTSFQKWETGKCLPGIKGLMKLAKFFGVTETELLHPKGESKENEDSKNVL